MLYSYVANISGHFEFQYGSLDKKEGLSFFDYNDELAYEDIDSLFQDLVLYHDLNVPKDGGVFIVKGLPACLGEAVGLCRIILNSDIGNFSKVRKGEILVTNATTPEMTPIMKKVSAIITDFGGITSHAAIVCRELNIPCIVGTRNATVILKDGMKVSVDAFRGIVSIDK
ncbi:hypothetical protein A3D00_04015 [Candidatus Woesebacteria bacterium RIFCSPHIGHO2_02_FULL_38_9]|uniref:PEP-utilising enzyme mobile domain-containing protein n=1 Tax=Candidatus Woesebacteria bacterium RIFCSPHIGHO2_01_FULL_39_28 TaxID=1802496 RepID=A0A1F7YFE3_9BACT|nr:MAG: hypothetical protein A2627_05475 [Candidatus Woesebacteria bacterium RIFCSPHIGHO2_01_FULL_39_28]OGM34092.1 MAG: hypothetical protein A3D00_04015 [Candidatus Woesebacteria bacterium RIFCSPHIGHO2_02_FULL_38_9]OGM58228.1 MAG: hypothetical protein A3A50_04430 [Candidatus Woesebacteria bacterium RIFCSPLOWO2_01_FULL_38_20]